LALTLKTYHCAHGFRTTLSTLSHHEKIKDAKAWDGDVVELQLAHLDHSTVEARRLESPIIRLVTGSRGSTLRARQGSKHPRIERGRSRCASSDAGEAAGLNVEVTENRRMISRHGSQTKLLAPVDVIGFVHRGHVMPAR
jgi:hypothetical protein